MRVGHDLEGQRCKRIAVVGSPLDGVTRTGVHALDRRQVHRRRQVFDHCVEEWLHTLVLECRAAQNRRYLKFQSPLTNRRNDFLLRHILPYQKSFHNGIIYIRDSLHQFFSILLSQLPAFFRNVYNLIRLTLIIFLAVDIGLHFNQIDDPNKFGLCPHRQLHGNSIGLKPLLHLPDTIQKVSARAIHLIDESDSRNLIFSSLPPYRFRLRLNTAHRAENSDRTIKNPQ